MTCDACGHGNRPEARFCEHCGAPLDRPERSEARRTVTVLFCDVVGSTELGASTDPESVRRVMRRYFETMRETLERHGGTVEKFIGDAVMAVFGIPRVREDDALRAVLAAVEMRTRLEELNSELAEAHGVTLGCRIGVNTGEVVVGDAEAGEAFATGDSVNVAARLEQAAQPMQIVAGVSTYELVRDAVEVTALEPLVVKGKAEPLDAYAILGVRESARGHERRAVAPLLGRRDELDALRAALDEAVRVRGVRMVAVLGDAGVGKTRLIEEFTAAIGSDVTILRGRCVPYGAGVSFWPLAEAVRDRVDELVGSDAEDADEVADRLGQVLRSEVEVAPQEVFWAARRVLEVLAADRPLVLFFDDLQWAEPLFLDLLEYVVERAVDAPILLLASARADLLEMRPTFGAVPEGSRRLLLAPLDEDTSRALIGHALGSGELDPQLEARVLGAAEGNPLFVQEMVALLAERGVLERRERWALSDAAAELPLPPTVEAILDARIDALPPLDREVLQRAAVIGDDFSWGAVEALTPGPDRAGVASTLMALVRRNLIRTAPSRLQHEEGFRFHHGLIREAAYRALPKGMRADLHRSFVGWLEGLLGPELEGVDELAAYHLEQAYHLREQLGPVTDDDRTSADRAADLLERAGRRAWNAGDEGAATNLLRRCLALRGSDDPRRVAILLILADIASTEETEEVVSPLLEEASAVAHRSGREDLVAWVEVFSEVAEGGAALPPGEPTSLERSALAAAPVLAAAGNHEALADILLAAGHEAEGRGQMHLARARFLQAADAARRAGDTLWTAAAEGLAVGGLILGPGPADIAISDLRSMMEGAGSDRPRWILAAWRLGMLLTRTRSYEEGRRLVDEARAVAEEIGYRLPWIDWWFATWAERFAGHPDRALRLLDEGESRWRTWAEWAQPQVYRAALLCDAGRPPEAIPLIQGTLDDPSPGDSQTPVVRHGTWARAVARTGGSRDEALRHGRAAVALADETDRPDLRADARLDLADVLDALGERIELITVVDKALAIYAAKGLNPPARRLRALGLEANPAG